MAAGFDRGKDAGMSIDFLLTSLIVVASPGTGALYTIATGLSRGVGPGIVAAFGCTLGIIPHMLAAITGLAAVFRTSALAFEIVKYLGVAYLLYMAWKTLRDSGGLSVQHDVEVSSTLRITLSAILMNLLNPKLSMFFLAFLPQFVSTDDPSPVSRMAELSAAFMLMTFVIFGLYGVFAAFMRTHVLSSARILAWMRRGFAVGFLGLAMKLALTQR